MPELPEAETIVRGLRRPVIARVVRRIEVLRPDLLDTPPGPFCDLLRGRTVHRIERRGKNIVLTVRSGEEAPTHLVVNLGMSGRLLHYRPNAGRSAPSHPGVRFLLDDGQQLIYDDVRRFGRLRALDASAFEDWSESLGPEPLSDEFTSETLSEAFSRTRTPIRTFLLDQRRIAGVGNIYANEACFRAAVHPRRRADGLNESEVVRLHREIRNVLREAVAARGTTLRDYRTAQGWKGSYAAQLRVYGREGHPCPRCGEEIRREVFGNRSIFVCTRCQTPEAQES